MVDRRRPTDAQEALRAPRKHPGASQKHPWDTQETPRAPRSHPGASQRHLRDAQETPSSAQGPPKGHKRTPSTTQETQKITQEHPESQQRETRDAQDTPDPRPSDFSSIFARVTLKNNDSTAEWQRRHSSTTTPAHKNDSPKCYDNNGATPGS